MENGYAEGNPKVAETVDKTAQHHTDWVSHAVCMNIKSFLFVFVMCGRGVEGKGDKSCSGHEHQIFSLQYFLLCVGEGGVEGGGGVLLLKMLLA